MPHSPPPACIGPRADVPNQAVPSEWTTRLSERCAYNASSSSPLCLSVKRAPVAQRTERVASDHQVAGSIPAGRATFPFVSGGGVLCRASVYPNVGRHLYLARGGTYPP